MPKGGDLEPSARPETPKRPLMPKGGDLEQKLLALSRRAAAELERAEKERQELHSNQEHLQQVCSQLESGLQMLTERVDAQNLDAAELPEAACRGGLAAARDGLEDRLRSQFEASLATEREQAHGRLKSSCSELVGHLNDLRCEMVKQRAEAKEQSPSELLQHLESHLAELGEGLTQQLEARVARVAEEHAAELRKQLTNVLESRALATDPTQVLSEKIRQVWSTLTPLSDRSERLEGSLDKLTGQVDSCCKDIGDFHRTFSMMQCQLREAVDTSCEALNVARDEGRTVHFEVMSIDTRVATIEERLSHRAERKRLEGSMPGLALDAEMSAYLSRSSRPQHKTLAVSTLTQLGIGMGTDSEPPL